MFELYHCFFVYQLASKEQEYAIRVDLDEVGVLIACRYDDSCFILSGVDDLALEWVVMVSYLDHHGVVEVIFVGYTNAWHHIYLLNTHYSVLIFKNKLGDSIKFQFKHLLLFGQLLNFCLYHIKWCSMEEDIDFISLWLKRGVGGEDGWDCYE